MRATPITAPNTAPRITLVFVFEITPGVEEGIKVAVFEVV
jgi:hypothetical protein